MQLTDSRLSAPLLNSEKSLTAPEIQKPSVLPGPGPRVAYSQGQEDSTQPCFSRFFPLERQEFDNHEEAFMGTTQTALSMRRDQPIRREKLSQIRIRMVEVKGLRIASRKTQRRPNERVDRRHRTMVRIPPFCSGDSGFKSQTR